MEQRDAAVSHHGRDLGIEHSINSHQGSTTIVVNPCVHHDTITTETIISLNTIGGIMFIMTSIDSGMPLCSEQHEARFVRKENCSPLGMSPLDMFVTPLMSFSEMMCRENIALHSSPYLKTSLM